MYDEDLDYGGRPLYARRTPEEQLKREEEIANLKKLLELSKYELPAKREIERRRSTEIPITLYGTIFENTIKPLILNDFKKNPHLYPSLLHAIKQDNDIIEHKLTAGIYRSYPSNYNPMTYFFSNIYSSTYKALNRLIDIAKHIYIRENLHFVPEAEIYPNSYDIKKYKEFQAAVAKRNKRSK
jgi:hypothetical protein